MFARLILFVKHLLVPLRSKPPTAEAIQAFDEYEDERGCYGQYPSPAEIYEYDVEWRDSMLALSLFTLLRWRLAVAWMPFCKGERRLIGKRLSRRVYPNLWPNGTRSRKKQARLRTERAEKRKVV